MAPFADLILFVHAFFVLFVLAGFLAVPVGGFFGWRWVRDSRLRAVHLAAIAFVAAEALAGIACPLTVWEDALRGRSAKTSFVARLVQRLLFYNLPEWAFTAAYAAAALTALVLWRAFPPSRRRP